MNIEQLLPKLQSMYPEIKFSAGDNFIWSPREKTITYSLNLKNNQHMAWSLMHETAHAALKHEHYNNDITLIRYETAAWQKAKQIASELGCAIEEAYIEDCLDTYRDWLHKRATCPKCSVTGMQQATGTYICFNCQTNWQVPKSPLCRTSRRVIASHV